MEPTDPAQSEPASGDLRRLMFINVGRAPRLDIVPAVVEMVDIPVEVHEIGVLDNLSLDEINMLSAEPGEPAISTYLSENIRVVLSRRGVAERFNAIIRKFRPNEYDLVVILSTGLPTEFLSSCPSVNAQRAVESAIISFLPRGRTIGAIYPLREQAENRPDVLLPGYPFLAASAREGDPEALLRALIELREADAILLNSVSYTVADYQMLTEATHKPVFLPRMALAGAIRIVLQRAQSTTAPALPDATRARLARLTPREREVLDLVCDGLSNKAIANALSISPKTVEVHRGHVMAKMEAPSLGALLNAVLGRRPDA